MSHQSTGLSRDERNGVHETERKAFSIEVFARRNGISRSQAFKEVATGRLIVLKVGVRSIVTERAERDWQNSLPRKFVTGPQHQRTVMRQKEEDLAGMADRMRCAAIGATLGEYVSDEIRRSELYENAHIAEIFAPCLPHLAQKVNAACTIATVRTRKGQLQYHGLELPLGQIFISAANRRRALGVFASEPSGEPLLDISSIPAGGVWGAVSSMIDKDDDKFII
jgi:hypothetical protein